jgi:undecaprenyl-diphosphatase
MNFLETTVLGAVQGLTEFLPVSSSGHLVVFQNLLGFREPELLLDVFLHVGTLLAVCLYFRSDIKKMVLETVHVLYRRGQGPRPSGPGGAPSHAALVWWVFVGSIPTGIIGIAFKSSLERFFGSVPFVGAMLVVTGLILLATRFTPRNRITRERIGYATALAVGVAQGLAILPGISRSGATIACGILCGLDREVAGRFSFLLSIPAIVGALGLQVQTGNVGNVGLGPLFAGFLTSALVGLVALKILMEIVKKGHLFYFSPYCWALGLFILAVA